MTTSITSGPTEGQKVQYARMMEDIVRHAVRLAFEQVEATSEGWQQVLARGDELKRSATELTVAKTRELAMVRRWREEDGVIYFSVVSDGTTGPAWIERLERKGFRLSRWAKDVLNSDDFQPTTGVTYNIAVLKGQLFTDEDRTTKNIRSAADQRKWAKPNAEVACLIRENFSDDDLEAMGLWWIVVMHEPIKDSDGSPRLLRVIRDDEGRWLDTDYGFPDGRWHRSVGFAFVVPQV